MTRRVLGGVGHLLIWATGLWITLLVDRNGYDIVIVLVNRFSKRPFLIPYYKNINTKEAARLYIYYIYQIYRLLDTIILDHGP